MKPESSNSSPVSQLRTRRTIASLLLDTLEVLDYEGVMLIVVSIIHSTIRIFMRQLLNSSGNPVKCAVVFLHAPLHQADVIL